jgi:hypothetical protein
MGTNISVADAASLLSEAGRLTKKVIAPALQDALLEIPEKEAFVLEMFYHEGEENEDIASMLGATTSQVRELKQQAKESLFRTQFGQKLETKERLESALKLSGRYWQAREDEDAQRFKQAIEQAQEEIA